MVQTREDPWVPAGTAVQVVSLVKTSIFDTSLISAGLEVVVSPRGGHNGFHCLGAGAGGDLT